IREHQRSEQNPEGDRRRGSGPDGPDPPARRGARARTRRSADSLLAGGALERVGKPDPRKKSVPERRRRVRLCRGDVAAVRLVYRRGRDIRRPGRLPAAVRADPTFHRARGRLAPEPQIDVHALHGIWTDGRERALSFPYRIYVRVEVNRPGGAMAEKTSELATRQHGNPF